MKDRLKRILLDHVGREHPVKAELLASHFGYKDDRIIRKAIEELIDEGFPVCSVTDHPAGYFFPANVDEARKYSKGLQKRAAMIFLRRRHIIQNTARHYEKARQLSLTNDY